MSEWKIEQTVFLSWYGNRNLTEAKITKIGRKWVSIEREFNFGINEAGRFDIATGEADDGSRFEKAWASREAHESAMQERRDAAHRRELWSRLRANFYAKPPDGLSTENMEQIMSAIDSKVSA
jgi:hypothetical protein